MFELSVYLRDKLIARSTFDADEVRMGRSADNDVQLENLALSRYHAAIETVDGVHILKDFGSKNGTYVNAQRVVGRRALDDGDRIGIGKFTLIFRTEAAPEAEKPEVRNQAAYSVAGETVVRPQPPEFRERTCPLVGFLEEHLPPPAPPRVYPIILDVSVIGSGKDCDIVLQDGSCPERVAAVVRGWTGFSVVALGRMRLNGDFVEGKAPLAHGDRLGLGSANLLFRAGTPEAGP